MQSGPGSKHRLRTAARPEDWMFLMFSLACAPADDHRHRQADEDTGLQLPDFVDDCDEALNETVESASGLWPEDGERVGAELCEGDLDVYVLAIPPNSWVSLAVEMDGSGKGGTDLDLWEVDGNDEVHKRLDLVEDEDESDFDVVFYSATEQPYERLAWHNTGGEEPILKWVVVDGFRGAEDDYELVFQVSDYEDLLDCDEAYDDVSEGGPCNRIMQFPQANETTEGYVVSHQAHYSNLRREVSYLVRWAAEETKATYDDTRPLGLLDMSQSDGDTPGRMEDSLRHPEGTHVYGNDVDIAYYQNGSDNLGRSVCPNDGYFCTGDPTDLDAHRTAFFMATLASNPNVRVIGVDPKIASAVFSAATELRQEGLIQSSDVNRLRNVTAYGSGWPFHQHHMHLSWDWEDGHSGRSEDWLDAGCMVDGELDPVSKDRHGPGLD